MVGKKRWYFPDAELPPMGSDSIVYGHEAIIILNPNKKDAEIMVTLFWTDRTPQKGIVIKVDAERVIGVRINEKNGFLGVNLNEGEQYAISLKSNIPVIAQYGRLDVRQSNMAFYTATGFQK